jgi:hypothetical protein
VVFLKTLRLLFYSIFILSLLSCTSDDSSFYHASLGAGTPKIIIASNSPGHYGVVMYDINGNFLKVLKDYIPENVIPNGLAPIDEFNFLVATDGVDQINKYSLLAGEAPYVTSANLSGNIFQIRRHPTYGSFVIEDNTIESFDDNGGRIGSPRIPTTVGGCTLNVPRGMTFNLNGQLVVVNTGSDEIDVYDVSDPINPICITANNTMGNINPVAVLAHSDGFLYVATQGNDSIYRFNGDGTGVGVLIFNNTGFIVGPSALLELPDGSILVASEGTDSIVRITTSGTLVGLTDFISDIFTESISDMILLQEGN